MATVKHRNDAAAQIDAYINGLPEWSKAICHKLRLLILKTSPKIIEDWKWGPNYFYEGMLCGFGAFNKHVSFVFFQGALLKDPENILKQNPGNVHNRHVKFTDVKEVNAKVLSAYLREAMQNNVSGHKIKQPAIKTVLTDPDLAGALRKAKLLTKFEAYTYYKRKELNEWVSSAKRAETKARRIMDAVEQVREGKSINDQYRK
ncbi:MAG: DUF1801 domain-containing protein [Bacteroidia bacterium]|nr:DUF1801 domain-containing protein [Bacteroidia bacterium]